MKQRVLFTMSLYAGTLVFSGMSYCFAEAKSASQTGTSVVNREHLPIAEPILPKSTTVDVRNAKALPQFQVTAPKNAPNVIVILIDDMGFGMPSAFGGPVNMPTADRLAKNGVKFNQFHTTALCSPTRAALLSGRFTERSQPPC